MPGQGTGASKKSRIVIMLSSRMDRSRPSTVLEDVRIEAVPRIRFTTEGPEMATDEVHISFPAMDGKRRTRWLRNLATEITTPELGPGTCLTL